MAKFRDFVARQLPVTKVRRGSTRVDGGRAVDVGQQAAKTGSTADRTGCS